MAQEAILRDRLADPIDFTVADGTGIEKGTLLTLTDPRTAVATTAASAMLAGIAAREKVASDGRTRLAVYREGIFDMYSSGAIAIGSWVVSNANSNAVIVANGADTASGAIILGTALEAATAGELFQVHVRVGG